MPIAELKNEFLKEYGHLNEFGMIVAGVFTESDSSDNDEMQIGIGQSCEDHDEAVPGRCHLSVMHPFIFDNRKLPESFMGIKILNVAQVNTIPPDIEEIATTRFDSG